MRIVHLIARTGDARAWHAARFHAARCATTVLLLQDAVLDPRLPAGEPGPEVVASARDMAARGVAGRHPGAGDGEIVELLLAADRVVCW